MSAATRRPPCKAIRRHAPALDLDVDARADPTASPVSVTLR